MCDDMIPVPILLRWLFGRLGREDATVCLAQHTALGGFDNLQAASSLLVCLLLVYALCILAFQRIIVLEPLRE